MIILVYNIPFLRNSAFRRETSNETSGRNGPLGSPPSLTDMTGTDSFSVRSVLVLSFVLVATMDRKTAAPKEEEEEEEEEEKEKEEEGVTCSGDKWAEKMISKQSSRVFSLKEKTTAQQGQQEKVFSGEKAHVKIDRFLARLCNFKHHHNKMLAEGATYLLPLPFSEEGAFIYCT